MEEAKAAPAACGSDVVAFLAHVIRLQQKAAETARQIERIETDLRVALNELERQRFEGYR
jgi:hypothetical protein